MKIIELSPFSNIKTICNALLIGGIWSVQKSDKIMQKLNAHFLNLMPLLQSLVPRACVQGIKSKAGAIKCCKEIKVTAPPNEWCNIPF